MRGIALIVAILAALANTSAAQAHASLVRSEPADRAVIAQPPPELTLTFNEPISPLALRLVQPNGEIAELNNIAANGATISVALPAGLFRGTHVLSWHVISADGHPVGGALTFSVGEPSAAPVPPRTETDFRWRGAIWLTRYVLYLGLFVGIGGVFYGRWIATSAPSERIGRALTITLECGLAAAVLSVGLQGIDALDAPLSALREPRIWAGGLATAYGLTLCIAIVALALGLAATSVTKPIARWCAALALAAVGAALAASGHASTAAPEWATRPAVFLHGVSVAFWVGALLPLAVALHAGAGWPELARFSKVIPLPLLILVASGFVLAVVQVRQLDALWSTSYGLILSAKLAAVFVLLSLAAANRALTPRVSAGDAGSAQRLRRSIQAELAIAVAILGLVACWRFTPPPRALLAAAAQPIRVHIHTEKAMADVQIGPAGADGRPITINLLDGQFRSLAAKEVVLVLSKPEAGIEPLRLPAVRVEDTIWRIDGVRIPMTGRWRVRIEILISDFEKTSIEDEIDLSG